MEGGAAAVAAQDEAARAGRALPSIVSGTGIPRTRRIQAGIDRGVLRPKRMFARIEPAGVRWADGAFRRADAIVWATGFRPELRHLAPLKLREKEGGVVVAAGFVLEGSAGLLRGIRPAGEHHRSQSGGQDDRPPGRRDPEQAPDRRG